MTVQKQMQKKAIFYTAAAIALSMVIIVTYSAYNTYTLSNSMDNVQTRVETINFFIKNIEKDLNKGAIVAAYRTLLSFDNYINDHDVFIDDVNKRFTESFINGTINYQPQDLMKNFTFTDWTNRISSQADKININFNFTVNNVQINQSDPWNVGIAVNLSLYIRDKSNTSYWTRNEYLTSSISIIGIKDPLYIYYSNGLVNATIRQTNVTNFVINGDDTNLMIHTNYSFYISHNDSPSFLMRLQGNLSNSTLGIESLANLDKFQKAGIVLKDRSIVDFIYFGAGSTVNYRINNTPSWFKIDQGHLDTYQVTNLTM